ncbi:MAG: GNAT family N-acetyltransferase [Vampirovibrionales bacterium]|nr:GNAT family N-acetyltransferase [Vampirovibrionales bacterium]
MVINTDLNATDMLMFRTASVADARLLYDWRNDPQTRQNSLETSAVSWEEHLGWLTRKLAEPAYLMHIAQCCQPDGRLVPAVFLRLALMADDQGGPYGYLSYTVNPELRGQGLGKAAVLQYAQQFKLPIQFDVLTENQASHRIAAALGARVVSQTPACVRYGWWPDVKAATMKNTAQNAARVT